MCPRGYYCDDKEKAKNCPSGTYSEEGEMSSSCLLCPQGKRCPAPTLPPEDCDFGKFSPEVITNLLIDFNIHILIINYINKICVL